MPAELKLPLPIAFTPLERMLAAVNIDGNFRRFSGIQRPQPTDPSTTTETYDYSEGDEELAGSTTPGNVSLVFTHVPEGMMDDFLSGAINSTLTVRFITRGSAVASFTPPATGRLTVAAQATADGFGKGLSELGAAGVDFTDAVLSAAVRAGQIREGHIIELTGDPNELAAGGALTQDQIDDLKALDLQVLEQPMPNNADPVEYKLFLKGRDEITPASLAINNGAFVIRQPSTIWEVSGTLLNYSPQFDQPARTARIEMTRGTEQDKNIRYENAHKAFTQYQGSVPFAF